MGECSGGPWKETHSARSAHLTLWVLVAATAVVFYGCLVGETVRRERSLISSA